MIRVLHVISGLETGGTELFLERLIQSLDEGEFEHQVVSLSRVGPVGEKLRRSGVRVDDLQLKQRLGVIPGLLKLSYSLRKARPDLVQGWLYHGNLAAGLAMRLGGVHRPLLWNIRHSLDQWKDEKRLLRNEIRISGWLVKMPTRVIFNSGRSAHQHERLGYPWAKTCVIPNGFDVERFAPNVAIGSATRTRLGIAPDDMVLGMLGRFHPLKDHANFMRAARIVANEVPHARFVLAGWQVTAENPVLMNQIQKLDLGDRVLMLGERNDVPDLLNSCDIYVSSSSSEAFPNAVGEAMSCGVPCVVTDVGDSAELVGDAGIVVPPKSPEALAKAILEMVKAGGERRRARGAATRERIRLNYSMGRVTQLYAELYRSVCESAITGR